VLRDRNAGALTQFLAACSPRNNLATLFSRPPSNFRPVDGLRAISILLVVAFHVVWLRGEYVGPAAWTAIIADPVLSIVLRGDLGVDVFFVISGFLISHILIVEHKMSGTLGLRAFYLRRAIRLLPAYFFVLAIVWVLRMQEGWVCETIWANILYVNNFISAERQCMPWAWSLAVEEQFYTVFPLVLLALYRLPRFRLSVLFLLMIAGVVVRGAVNLATNQHLPIVAEPWIDEASYIESFNVYGKTYMRFGAILCGVIAAYLYHYNSAVPYLERSRLRASVGLLLAISCLVVVVVPPVRTPSSGWVPLAELVYLTLDRYAFSAAIAYLLLLGLCSTGPGRVLGAVLSARPWYPVAQLSYSTYLVHLIAITACYRYLLNPTDLSYLAMLWALLVCVAVSLLASLVVYLAIERPFMGLRSWVAARSPPRASAQAPQVDEDRQVQQRQ
jgi:peptidoglycan/LPS O-acetylase OafA/YrhL